MSAKEPETLAIQKKLFFSMAKDNAEYLKDVSPSEELFQKLRRMRVDIFTFLERKWCFKIPNPKEDWAKAEDNVAIIQTSSSYQEWLKVIGKKTRNMIRKAEKSGIRTEIASPSEKLADGIWKTYNETPIRQERGFPHYGMPLETVRKIVFQPNCTYIAAYLQDEFAGFVQLVHGENITIISQILSLQKHRDKAVNNALIAKVIEFCATNNSKWIMYGRIGNHPSLDDFKQSNGFHRLVLARYFVPLTSKGRIVIRLGLQREIKDSLPRSIKTPLIPIYNLTSRTRMRVRLLLRRKTRVIQSP
jgi:hypothetical protein